MILIDVTTYNRKWITFKCLDNIYDVMPIEARLLVRDDCSTEYSEQDLKFFANDVRTSHGMELPEARWRRIHPIRYQSLLDFLRTDFEYLYLMDNDVIHDPGFFDWAKTKLELGIPISGYLNKWIKRGRKISFSKDHDVYMASTGGASMLLNRKHVEKIVSNNNGFKDLWDCKIWKQLGGKILVPKQSLVEHFGANGLHHSNMEQERAVSPTEWLTNKRKELLDISSG